MIYYGFFESLTRARMPWAEWRMKVGETWEEVKLGSIIAMTKDPDCRLLLTQVWFSICSLFYQETFFRIAEFWAHLRLPELPYAFSDTQQFTGLGESQWELKVCFSACSLDTGSSVFSLGLLPQTSYEWIYLQGTSATSIKVPSWRKTDT